MVVLFGVLCRRRRWGELELSAQDVLGIHGVLGSIPSTKIKEALPMEEHFSQTQRCHGHE
jgi:hypothetical protein